MTAKPMRGSWQRRLTLPCPGFPVHGVPGFFGQGIVAAIIVAQAIGKAHISRCRAALIDPGVFVRRHGLRGQLATDPVGFFAHDDRLAQAQRGKRRADGASPAADD